MRRFSVTVNGNVYEVEVEELGAGVSAAPVSPAAPVVSAPSVPAVAPTAAPAPAAPKASAPAGRAGSVSVSAPMPGTILKMNVSVGQAVKKGDVICVLEAMKMENDIPAPEDGTVASVNVQKGASVNSGDVLVTMN